MDLRGLHHLNIRCSESDLPAIENFYGEVLGLKTGYRPDFQTPGIWLYSGSHPIVHVSARFPEGSLAGDDKHNGSVDHIAFNVTGAASFQKTLARLGVAYEVQNVPNAGFQIFLHDPVGTKLEFNFPNDEAPSSVAKGTMAPMQLAT